MDVYARDYNWVGRSVACPLRYLRYRIRHILAGCHFSKDGVGIVEMRSWCNGYEELASVCSWARIGHC